MDLPRAFWTRSWTRWTARTDTEDSVDLSGDHHRDISYARSDQDGRDEAGAAVPLSSSKSKSNVRSLGGRCSWRPADRKVVDDAA